MDLRIKAGLCAAPYLLAFIVWFTLIGPMFSEGQTRDTEMTDRQKEEIEVKSKLLNLGRLQREKTGLTKDIEQLRSSVPKQPDLDLLMIDVEKMILASDMEIISVEKADASKKKDHGRGTSEGGSAKPANANMPVEKKPQAKAGAKEQPVESGLSKVPVMVEATGDYTAFTNLMKKLESYERIIGVDDITIELPEEKAEKKGKEADAAAAAAAHAELSKHLAISFMITAYYLP